MAYRVVFPWNTGSVNSDIQRATSQGAPQTLHGNWIKTYWSCCHWFSSSDLVVLKPRISPPHILSPLGGTTEQPLIKYHHLNKTALSRFDRFSDHIWVLFGKAAGRSTSQYKMCHFLLPAGGVKTYDWIWSCRCLQGYWNTQYYQKTSRDSLYLVVLRGLWMLMLVCVCDLCVSQLMRVCVCVGCSSLENTWKDSA